MQVNIDRLRGKVNSFQKQIDEFRVQYDLKSSAKSVSNQFDAAKKRSSKPSKTQSKIYNFSWKAECFIINSPVIFDVSIDLNYNNIKVINVSSGSTFRGKLITSNGGYKFNLGVTATDNAFDGDFMGRVTPSGGTARLEVDTIGCSVEENLF